MAQSRIGNSAAIPTSFIEKKTETLRQLAVPEASYTDLSPKGSVDEGIRELIDVINAYNGLVTTSSCAGRVSVFVEGRKDAANDAKAPREQVAGVGGKGGGGTWLFVSHDFIPDESWISSLGLETKDENSVEGGERRLIHFKFEPMILHVLTASPAHAQLVLKSALQAGFRESGAINIDSACPMVAVRSMGLGFESLIGYADGPRRHALVDHGHLRLLGHIANERFVENARRIARFRDAIQKQMFGRTGPSGAAWEDSADRKERMRAEGLRRKAEMAGERAIKKTSVDAPVEEQPAD